MLHLKTYGHLVTIVDNVDVINEIENNKQNAAKIK